MDLKPSVLFFSSCNEFRPIDTIRSMVNGVLPQVLTVVEDIQAYPYHIDNKYYTADVLLCDVDKKTIGNQAFADSVQAVVLYFNSQDTRGLETAESWLPFVNEFDPDIKILLCKCCPSDSDRGCGLRQVQEWCISKGFELVELEPEVDRDVDDVEDDFPETTGIQRIIQALNAHVWPNLTMKTKNKSQPATDIDKSLQDFAGGSTSDNDCLLEESLDELLDKDDDFSELFAQLPEMKARVGALSGADRMAAAEQVVKAFWKAIGGDDTEFDDF